jgi:hypothetical protein
MEINKLIWNYLKYIIKFISLLIALVTVFRFERRDEYYAGKIFIANSDFTYFVTFMCYALFLLYKRVYTFSFCLNVAQQNLFTITKTVVNKCLDYNA